MIEVYLSNLEWTPYHSNCSKGKSDKWKKENLEEKKKKEKFCQFIPIKIGSKSCQIVEGLFLLFTSTTYISIAESIRSAGENCKISSIVKNLEKKVDNKIGHIW